MKKKKEKNKNTKAYQKKVIKTLKNKCLKLWKECVKIRADNKCEATGTTEQLNAHHIEDYATHSYLRYALCNGICLSPTAHKFGSESAHKSFLFMLDMMAKYPERFAELKQLADKLKTDKPEQTVEYFENIIKDLTDIKLKGTKNV